MSWWESKTCWRAVVAACLWASTVAVAQPTNPAVRQPQPPAQPNLLLEGGRSLGIKRCLPALERLSSVAVAGSQAHDVLLDWDRAQPDGGALFSLLGIQYGGQSIAATVTAIPHGDGCTFSAERISVAPFTCASIAQVELGGYQRTALLPTFTVYSRADDPGASVSLIDSPPGCLVIRRHIQYAWKPPVASGAVR